MKKRNKLFSLLFVAILVCACVFPMLFAFDCPSMREDDSESRSFYVVEGNIEYFCYRAERIAYVYTIYYSRKDKKTGSHIDDFSDDLETVVIPESIRDGKYKVVGLYGRAVSSFSSWSRADDKISIAPKCWKNVKKIYLPYTVETMYFEGIFAATESPLYEGRLRVTMPNIEAKKGFKQGSEYNKRNLFRGNFFSLAETSATDNPGDFSNYILATVPQKHYDMVVEQYGTLETPPTENVEEYVQNLVTPNYVFNFNYEGAPNEGIYWIDLIENENTVFVLPTNPTREGYTFGGWYTEEDCITEWDSKMTPTAKVKNMYAKWVPVETEQPTESEETAE